MMRTSKDDRYSIRGARRRTSRALSYSRVGTIPSGDAHHGAAGDSAFEVSGKRAGQLIEGDGARDDPLEVPGSQVRGDALPDRQPRLALRRGGVDAKEGYAAQDERHHGRLELRAARHADAGDVAPEVHGAREPGEHLPAHTVDGAGEADILQGPGAEVEVLAREDIRCTQLLQVARRGRLAPRGPGPVAAGGEHVDRDAAHASGGAGDRNRSASRGLAVVFHAG